MTDWDSFLENIEKELSKTKCDLYFFRGHNDTSWKLTPSIYREVFKKFQNPRQFELSLHIDFSSNCGPIYNRKLNDWDILLEMRHAGLPTRLLDWTENFGSALFFSLRDVNWDDKENLKKYQPCIWILNPYKLNKEFFNEKNISVLSHLDVEYDEATSNSKAEIKKRFPGPIPLIVARRQRIFAQKSVFTFHPLDYGPIEKICQSCVKKFEIPLDCIPNAKNFLKLAGINEYSMYPDLDGLGRYLKDFHKIDSV